MKLLPIQSFRRFAILAAGWFATVVATLAQGTGTIQGRVYNPATGQYVRNAEVRLEGTNQVASTESDGSFTFNNVPAGQAAVTVTYTGYTTARETFTVASGQTATREINLTSGAASTQKPGEVVQLQA